MPPPQTPTVFYGPLVNPTSISSFQALPRCLLAVGASGDIDWIEEDVHESALQAVLARHGLLNVPLVDLKHGEFILPGFVDTHTVRTLSLNVPWRASRSSIYRWQSVARTASTEHREVSAPRTVGVSSRSLISLKPAASSMSYLIG
jgi:hypothetical protein